jgi:hypothetical protein
VADRYGFGFSLFNSSLLLGLVALWVALWVEGSIGTNANPVLVLWTVIKIGVPWALELMGELMNS